MAFPHATLCVQGIKDGVDKGMSVAKKDEAPSVAHPDPLDFDTASGVLEHMLREVVGSESFEGIIDEMLTQETPFFVQFENSAAPGDADPTAKTEAGQEDAAPEIPEPGIEADNTEKYTERMTQLAKDLDRPEPKWTSALLMNFEDLKPPRSLPEDDQLQDDEDSDDDDEAEEPTGEGAKEENKEEEQKNAEQLWDDTLGEYGEVDLDTFKSSVAEVLEDMLLSTMDDVIGGRFNWTRPPPRTKRK